MKTPKNVISILVNNKPDVLARISGMFSARNFNIESISANVTMDPDITKIIITTIEDNDTQSKILKHISRLVDIIEVKDLTKSRAVRREMFLVRIKWGREGLRKEVGALVDQKKWKILRADNETCIVEITGEDGALLEEIKSLERLGMDDFVRSGVIVLE